MPTVEYMRNFVKNMYSTPAWARKVKNMSDNQVMAIYMKNVGRSKPKTESEPDNPPKSDIPF